MENYKYLILAVLTMHFLFQSNILCMQAPENTQHSKFSYLGLLPYPARILLMEARAAKEKFQKIP